jgi:cation:H+ antiporter
LQDLALIFLGLLLLWGGTEFVLFGAINIARRYGMSEILIGLTILAIGSDLPETVVAIHGAFLQLGGVDTSGLVVGNAIGSAFGQIGLVMGIAGVIGYMTLSERFVFMHGGMLLLSVILLFLAGQDGMVSRIEGGSLVAAFIIYLGMAFRTNASVEKGYVEVRETVIYYWSAFVAGLIVVYAGSELTIDSTTALAHEFGVSQSLIAIVIVGIGTSLPELTISVTAALKKQGGLSVGNLIGSNIYDSLVPVGAASIVAPLSFERGLLWFDLPVLLCLSAVTLIFFRRKRGLQRSEAIVLLLVYVGYIAIKIAKG